MFYTYYYTSPIGKITLASNGTHLTGLWIEGQKYFPSHLPADKTTTLLSVFRQTQEWLDAYFKGENPDYLPNIELKDTPFRLAVWEILKHIPYGETVTYKDIAKEVARQNNRQSMSAQAIGGAIGHNPVSIIIPCHRVIGSNGSLTGYAGGIERKIALFIIRKSKFPQNPKRSVRFSGKRTKRSVQKRKARNTQKAETKVL